MHKKLDNYSLGIWKKYPVGNTYYVVGILFLLKHVTLESKSVWNILRRKRNCMKNFLWETYVVGTIIVILNNILSELYFSEIYFHGKYFIRNVPILLGYCIRFQIRFWANTILTKYVLNKYDFKIISANSLILKYIHFLWIIGTFHQKYFQNLYSPTNYFPIK